MPSMKEQDLGTVCHCRRNNYCIMAVAHKMELSLGTKEGINSAVNNFLSGMSWRDCSKFNEECVTNWTHLFAERDVTYETSIS